MSDLVLAYRLRVSRCDQPAPAQAGARARQTRVVPFAGRPAPPDSLIRFDRHAPHTDIPLLVDFWDGLLRSLSGIVPLWRRLPSQSYPPNSLDTHALAKLLRVVLRSGR
jgi:thioredoxin 2